MHHKLMVEKVKSSFRKIKLVPSMTKFYENINTYEFLNLFLTAARLIYTQLKIMSSEMKPKMLASVPKIANFHQISMKNSMT